MPYDELVKRLRDAAKMSEALAVLLPHSEGNATAKLYNEAADAIEELSKQLDDMNEANIDLYGAFPKWIPVTERLPEDIDKEVLVCTEDYGDNDLGFATVATYGVNGWLECWERKTYLTDVTHWMPLPEPPKEEE